MKILETSAGGMCKNKKKNLLFSVFFPGLGPRLDKAINFMRRLWLKPRSHMESVETQKTSRGEPPPPAYQECGPPPTSYDQITGRHTGHSDEAMHRLCVCVCVFVLCVCVCVCMREVECVSCRV